MNVLLVIGSGRRGSCNIREKIQKGYWEEDKIETGRIGKTKKEVNK